MKSLLLSTLLLLIANIVSAQHLSIGDGLEIQFVDDKESKTYYAISSLWEGDKIYCHMSHSGDAYHFQLLNRIENTNAFEAKVIETKGGLYKPNAIAHIVIYEVNLPSIENNESIFSMKSQFAILSFSLKQSYLAERIGVEGENTIYRIKHSGKLYTISPLGVVKKSNGSFPVNYQLFRIAAANVY